MSQPPAPLDHPTPLAGLIDYADGSVVSRTITKEPTGTVTLFAFDAGEGLSEHTAPYDALVFAVDGRARITVGGAAHDLAAGAIIRLPANVPHAVEATAPFKMLLVMIRTPNSAA